MKRPARKKTKRGGTSRPKRKTTSSLGTVALRKRRKFSAAKLSTASDQSSENIEEEIVEEVAGQKVRCLITRNTNGREIYRQYGVPPFLKGTLDRYPSGRWSVGYDYGKVEVQPAAAQVLKGLRPRERDRIILLMNLLEGFADDANQRPLLSSTKKHEAIREQMDGRAAAVGHEITRAIIRNADDFHAALRGLRQVYLRDAENRLLLLAVIAAAKKARGVPTHMEVRRARGNREGHDDLPYDKTTFSKALKRIGFDWLPKAKRSSRW